MLKRLIGIAALPLIASAATAQSPVAEARALWKGNIGYVTQAAEELSDSLYAYRPTPEVRSFGELFAHIAGSQFMYCAMALGDKIPGEGDVEKTAKGKVAILAALKQSNTYCEKAYTQADDQVKSMIDVFGQQHSRFYTLIANASHDGEHYGNIVTYMRLNKMVPPSSRPRSQ